MKIKPFEDAGYFTTFHNGILDYIMPLCNGSEWKVVCATVRKTIGWHKEEDWISLSQYKKITGVKSVTTIANSIKSLIKKKILVRKPYNDSYKYSLNREYSVVIDTSEVTIPKNGIVENGKVSIPKTDNTKDIPIKDINNDVGFGEVITKWESLRGTINAHISERLGDIYDELIEHIEDLPGTHPDWHLTPGEFLVEAISHMGDYADTPSVAYLEKVVGGWKRHGVGSKPPGKRGNNRKPTRQSTEDRVNELMEQVGDGK